MVIKIQHIIVGTFNNIFKRNKNISNPRLKICNECENKIDIMGGVCEICGCILKSKATVENEQCPINKW